MQLARHYPSPGILTGDDWMEQRRDYARFIIYDRSADIIYIYISLDLDILIFVVQDRTDSGLQGKHTLSILCPFGWFGFLNQL